MKTTVLAVGSVTYAQKAKKLLAREGLVSKLIKTDASAVGMGCTYGIEIPSKNLFSAANVLRSNGVSYEAYEK